MGIGDLPNFGKIDPGVRAVMVTWVRGRGKNNRRVGPGVKKMLTDMKIFLMNFGAKFVKKSYRFNSIFVSFYSRKPMFFDFDGIRKTQK